MPLTPDGADQEPFEGAPRFAWCPTLLPTTRQIALSRGIQALLGERDLVEQTMQTAIALTIEPVAQAAGAGGFQRCDTRQSGEPGLPEWA